MSNKVYCTPTCKYFQCTGNHLSVKFTRQNKRLIMCQWAGDLCIGYKCKFASCKINKLLSDGTCALKTKKKDILKNQNSNSLQPSGTTTY